MIEIDLNEQFIIYIVYKGCGKWYISDKEIWYLDYQKRIEAYRKRGYEIKEEYIDEERRDLLYVDEKNALLFLKRIEEDECSTGDLKELFRNITYYDLPYKTLTKSYINIQHYASRYFNNPAGKSIGLQNAIQILNLDQDKSYHNALNDAYYTAQVFIRIYNPSIVPDVYMYTTVKPSSAKKNIKKQINYDKLFAEFAKILQRDLTKEDKKIIDLAYKMGKTNQFLTESTIYKKR